MLYFCFVGIIAAMLIGCAAGGTYVATKDGGKVLVDDAMPTACTPIKELADRCGYAGKWNWDGGLWFLECVKSPGLPEPPTNHKVWSHLARIQKTPPTFVGVRENQPNQRVEFSCTKKGIATTKVTKEQVVAAPAPVVVAEEKKVAKSKSKAKSTKSTKSKGVKPAVKASKTPVAAPCGDAKKELNETKKELKATKGELKALKDKVNAKTAGTSPSK